ncbi:MAG: hypothetical protein NTV87_11900 [Ignavibacteriae bacterium]|jgi:hypothetical protein|nr:hypothetical protein [Ignavibacteriota bacterium]
MKKVKSKKKCMSNEELGKRLVRWARTGKGYCLIKFAHSIGFNAKQLCERANDDEHLSEILQMAREASELKINEMALNGKCDTSLAKYLIDYGRQFFKNDIGDEPVVPVIFVEAETKNEVNSDSELSDSLIPSPAEKKLPTTESRLPELNKPKTKLQMMEEQQIEYSNVPADSPILIRKANNMFNRF